MNDASAGQGGGAGDTAGDTQLSTGPVIDGQAGARLTQPDLWHYKDERSGKRLGPVDRSTIAEIIAGKRINRATLVWQPAMADWVKAGQTDLVSLFGNEPPPLPAGKVGRSAIYALACFPLWGMLIVFLASVPLARQLAIEPQVVFASWVWLLFFVFGNYVLSTLDEHSLRMGGARVIAPSPIGSVLTPVYILASCLAVHRHGDRRAWLAYLPLLLWLLACVGAYLFEPLAFNPDAPAFFNPDQWL